MTQFNAPTYDIERPTGHCAFTGRQLQPGEPYMAILVELDPNTPPPASAAAISLGFKRLDVSLEAWNEGKRPERVFSYWRSTVAQPHQKRKLFVDDQMLVDLFRRLTDSPQPERRAFRFVLGLILMRKKQLRYDGSVAKPDPTGNPQEWWLLTPKLDVAKGPMGKWNEQDKMEMLNPHLDETQVQQVGSQLSEILQAEL